MEVLAEKAMQCEAVASMSDAARDRFALYVTTLEEFYASSESPEEVPSMFVFDTGDKLFVYGVLFAETPDRRRSQAYRTGLRFAADSADRPLRSLRSLVIITEAWMVSAPIEEAGRLATVIPSQSPDGIEALALSFAFATKGGPEGCVMTVPIVRPAGERRYIDAEEVAVARREMAADPLMVAALEGYIAGSK